MNQADSKTSVIPNKHNVQNTNSNSNYSFLRKVLLIIGVLLIIIIAGSVVYFWQKSANEKTISRLEQKISSLEEQVSRMEEVKTSPQPPLPPLPYPTPTTDQNTYTNGEYGFSFDLREGEYVVECPNKNEYNDNMAVGVVVQPPIGDPSLDCGVGGWDDAIFASKKAFELDSAEDYLRNRREDYSITESQTSVGGVSGIRIVGEKIRLSPGANQIDELVFYRNGVLYVIPNEYINRGFQFLN